MAERLKWTRKKATQFCCDYVRYSNHNARTYGPYYAHA